VVVIDAVGEWDTVSIWGAMYDRNYRATYKKLWSQSYPHSIGLFYSAITKRIGLHPLDEEYITMGMAGWGTPKWTEVMRDVLLENPEEWDKPQNEEIAIITTMEELIRHVFITKFAVRVAKSDQMIGNTLNEK
jgi:predicted NodU family carbamoyl transferase